MKKRVETQSGSVVIYSLPELERSGAGAISKLPYSIKVILESALRNLDGYSITEEDVKKIASWTPGKLSSADIAFKPARVILQDFTGVPTLVDLAAMRSAMKRLGGDYKKINPLVPCDLVVDHSVQVDAYGSPGAFAENIAKEFERNRERYEFLKWGQRAFQNFRVVPPATGIVHQVNLEYLAQGVMMSKNMLGETVAYPDSVMGTDSHTTMVNGLGVLGWGVGGIEAETVMLGEPIFMLLPEVVGFKFKGALSRGVTATDLVLTVTQILRAKGVVGKFVEFYGEGLSRMSLPDRATIANMAPEYGATMGFFPVDDETLAYYRVTGRRPEQVDLIERVMKEQGMFYVKNAPDPTYGEVVELDLATVEPSLAGPKRPQDRVGLSKMKSSFRTALEAPVDKRGFGLSKEAASLPPNGAGFSHGAVAIAAITSCTNTSNPSVMIGAGLLAKKAVERGLTVQSYVKTSLAPGSLVVSDYLDNAGLTPYLEKLGFHTVGYGCTTCIGNSGPLPDDVAQIVKDRNLVVASVLSGNRNFEGRVNPLVKANYLASPPLVVAFALAGRVDIDLENEPIGKGKDGRDVYLKEIWPAEEEIQEAIRKSISASVFEKRYRGVFEGSLEWAAIKSLHSDLYEWHEESTYIQEPPFFEGMGLKPEALKPLARARVLGDFGDSITTDHISPAGNIAADSPAGKYLIEKGVPKSDFNSYGARRGNDRVMVRGTFANVRLRNRLTPGKEGWWTLHFPTKTVMPIYDAAIRYAMEKTPLIILAGKEYGTGSSRDWAAKGTALLGVRAVIAQSFERIHRSNLCGMGVLPLEFKNGESAETLGLSGEEFFDFEGLGEGLKPFQNVRVTATAPEGSKKIFETTARVDTPVEVDYYKNGGILQTVLRKLAKQS
jgi:aconitate hydratase